MVGEPRNHESTNPVISCCRAGVAVPAGTRLRADRDALHGEDLDMVADLDVVEPFEADTALETGLHLAHIVLEPAERPDLALVHDDVVADQARLRVAAARDPAVGHHAAGNRAELRDLERVAHLGDAEPDFL